MADRRAAIRAIEIENARVKDEIIAIKRAKAERIARLEAEVVSLRRQQHRAPAAVREDQPSFSPQEDDSRS